MSVSPSASATATSSEPTASPSAQPCSTSQLAVSAVRSGGKALPTALEFRNTAKAACTLSGVPGVSYVRNAGGVNVGPLAVPSGGPSRVVLDPGGRARAPLSVRPYSELSVTKCRPTSVGGLQVSLPGQSTKLFVPSPGVACGAGTVSLLKIGSLQAG